MSVNEYLDKFTQLSRYAPDEVNTDSKRQERFLDGLIGPLNYQLQSHTFPDFATLLNKAIGLENKRKELGEQKCMFQSQEQSSSNTPPRYSFSQNPQFHSGGQWKTFSKHAPAALVSAAPTLQPTNSPHSKLLAKPPSSYSRCTSEEHNSSAA
jgi:hypothetical protein